jgi:hypothetical protein
MSRLLPALLAAFLLLSPTALAKAPAPGAKHTWTPADKHG